MLWNKLYKNKETYFVSCKKNTAKKKNSSVRRTKKNELIPVSNYAIYGKKNQDLIKIKRQEDCKAN